MPRSDPSHAETSWFQRNWTWVLSLGCLGIFAVSALIVLAIAFALFGSIRLTTPYKEAVAMSQDSDALILEMGEPIEPGWFVTGSVNTSGPTGEAHLSIPIRGSRKRGTLYVVAEKRAGRWEFQRVEVEIKGREERIDLLKPFPLRVFLPASVFLEDS